MRKAAASLVTKTRHGRFLAVLITVVSLNFISLMPTGYLQSGGTITTYAGTIVCGFSGDSGPAINAQLQSPAGIDLDNAGNLYIVDFGNQVVRQVTSFGTIATIAGTGAPGFNGDNKLATNAQLNAPNDVAVDPSGRNLYIADNANHRVRRVDLNTHIMTTVAGTGEPGFSGDGGPAKKAQLQNPADVAVDVLGNLYIADSQNFRIRKVDTNGIITTVAGNGQAGFSGDNGPATQAGLKQPVAVAVGPSGDLFIADWADHRVRRVDTRGMITTVAGDGRFRLPQADMPATGTSLKFPFGLASDSLGNLYISDSGANMVLRVDQKGILTIVAGTGTPGSTGDGGPATEAQLNGPSKLAVDRFGNLFISDTLNCRVRRVTAP